MPPKKDTSTSTNGAITLTAKEMSLLDLCLKSMPVSAKTNIDFAAIATAGNFSNAKSARECFRPLCKKHGWFEADEGGSGDGTTSTPVKTPRKPSASAKKSAKKAADTDANIDETPTKKAKIEKEAVNPPADATMEEFFNIGAATKDE